MAYETYVPQRGRAASGKPVIRILKNGDLSVSPMVQKEFFKGASHVELLYDSRTKKVGLKPRKKPTKASYKLRPSPQGGNRYYVSAGSFLEHYGIGAKKARTHEASWNKRAGVAEFSVR